MDNDGYDTTTRQLGLFGLGGEANGYASVPSDHPWHGVDYADCTDVPACAGRYCGHAPDALIDVHGGVTFAGTLPGHGDVWWFGFDTAHYGDTPGRWTVAAVEAEAARMSTQLKSYGGAA